MKKEVLEAKFVKSGVLWRYDGDVNSPHAILTSGLHSDTFFNGTKLLENPHVLQESVKHLAQKLQQELKEQKLSNPDYIVSPAMGAILVGYELARIFKINFAFTEPEKDEFGNKTQKLKRFYLPNNISVLLVEDVISTGKSIIQTANELKKLSIKLLPIFASLINRSGKKEIEGYKIVSLLDLAANIYSPKDCPLCKMGSKALRPKKNWEEFIRCV